MTRTNGSDSYLVHLIKKHPVTTFMVLVFVVTYPVGIAALIGLQSIQDMLPDWVRDDFLTGSLSRFAPTLVGFLFMFVLAGPHSFSVWFRQVIRWRIPASHYIFMFTSVLFLWAIAVLATVELASVNAPQTLGPSLSLFQRLVDYGGEIVYVTLSNGEETGWRFVLLGILLTRMRLFKATVILGVLWAFWHLPIMLLTDGGLRLFPAFFCILMALSVVMSWLYKSTHSLLAPLLYHGIFNATTEYAYERQFSALSEAIASHEVLTAWLFAVGFCIVAVSILLTNRKLFFGPVETPPHERWLDKSNGF